MSGVIGVIVLSLLAIVVGFLAARAWRIRRMVWRLVAGLAASVVGLVLTLLSLIGLAGIYRLYLPHGPAVQAPVSVTSDQVAIAQRHAIYCAGCHSENGQLPLGGGNSNFIDGLGTLEAPNLTPAGPLKDWSDGEILRAIRDGVDKNGHPLVIMPSDAFHHLSDTDAAAMVAYIRSQPAVQHDVPARNLNLIATELIGAGLFPTAEQPAEPGPVTAPPKAASVQYGTYLVQSIGCASCHGRNLTGKQPGQGPAGSNLTYIVPKWSEGEFLTMFETGVDPTGHKVSDEMPWKAIGEAYDQTDLQAMYAYLHTLKATPGPNG